MAGRVLEWLARGYYSNRERCLRSRAYRLGFPLGLSLLTIYAVRIAVYYGVDLYVARLGVAVLATLLVPLWVYYALSYFAMLKGREAALVGLLPLLGVAIYALFPLLLWLRRLFGWP